MLYTDRRPYTPFTPEQIKELLDAAETQEAVFWGKELVVSYQINPTVCIVGIAFCGYPENFDIEVLREMAREYAEKMFLKQEGHSVKFP